MQIITDRLLMFPLTYEQELKYMRCDHSLETELGLAHSDRYISAELLDAMTTSILPALQDGTKDIIFHSNWLVIDKALNTIVASFIFHGAPDGDRKVEIGYGTEPAFEGRGYMTAAVAAVIDWARSRPDINSIEAGTESDNIPSQKILINNGFKEISRTGTSIRWSISCL